MVLRISHNRDIIFIITKIEDDIAYLEGIYVRLLADAPITDLELASNEDIRKNDLKDKEYEQKIIDGVRRKKGFITGKVVHIDGDKKYLDKCLNLYKKLNVYAVGFYFLEH